MCIVNNMKSKLCSCIQIKSLQEYRSQMNTFKSVKREAPGQVEGPTTKLARTSIETNRSTKRFKCNLCGIGYYLQDHLNTHITRQHAGNFSLAAQQIRPQDSQQLIYMNNSNENTGTIVVQPPIPNKTQPTGINGLVKNLNKRISTTTTQRFRCDDCRKSFGNESAYKQHTIIMHNKVGPSNFSSEDEPENVISSIFGQRTLVFEPKDDLPKPNKYSWGGHHKLEPKSKSKVSSTSNTPKPRPPRTVYIQKQESTFKVPARKKPTSYSRKGVSKSKADQPWKTDPTIPHPNQMTVSVVCKGLGLNDYPVPVNKRNQEFFRHRPNFDAFIYPLLRSVNPTANHFMLLTLGQAKWYEVILTELQA